MDLEYIVTNQVIERTDKGRPANLSQEYLRLCFTFSADWSGLAKFALFKTSDGTLRTALSQDKVVVPASVLTDKKFLFSVYGVDGDDLRITTNLVRVNLLESGFTHQVINDDSELDDPTTVEEIYAEINKKAYSSDMATALDGKSDVGHTHKKSDITDFTHSHTESDITDFGDYAERIHTHTKSDITDFPTKVSSFTNDVGYLTEHQSLSSYYTKAEVDTLIQNANNRITLEADKTIIQNEETCTFTVYVLKDGFQRAGETVNIYAEED